MTGAHALPRRYLPGPVTLGTRRAGEFRQAARAAVKRTLIWLRGQCALEQWFWLQRDYPTFGAGR